MKKVVLVALALLTIVGCKDDKQKRSMAQYFATANGVVELKFPAGWYKNEKDNPYDLQCFSKNDRLTTGVFLFMKGDLATDSNPQDVFKLQIDDLRSKRKHFKILKQKEIVHLEKKTLTTIVYSGDKGSLKYYYRYTLIEFSENVGDIVVVLQVAIPSEWDRCKPILEEITKSARIRLKKPQDGR